MKNIVSISVYSAKQLFDSYLFDNPEHIVINFHNKHVSAYCQHCFHQEIIKEKLNGDTIINCIGNFVNEHAGHEEVEDMEDESENIEFIGEDFGVYKSTRNQENDDSIPENIIPFKKRSC